MSRLSKFKDRLGRGKKDSAQEQANLSQTATVYAPPSPGLQKSEGGSLNLVNYSPEELIQHVEHTLSRVQFGWTRTAKWMEGFSEFWSWMGPLVLLAGTIGEVYLVLWLRQKNQDVLA